MSEVKTPPWLKKVQEESWQAEILLSGIILYSLFKLPEIFENFLDTIAQEYYYNISLGDFKGVVMVAIQWLIIGFITHLFLRGIWVAFVGLSHIFPKGIQHKNLKYQARFSNHIQNISPPKDKVVKLENYCSGIFSVSFFFFMLLLGLVVFNLVFNYLLYSGLVFLGFDKYTWINDFAFAVLALFIVIYLIDFLTLGWIKKIKYLHIIYFPVYKIFNWFTLSFLYRDIYYTFASNLKKSQIIFSLIFFLALSILMFFSDIDRGVTRIRYFVPHHGNAIYSQQYDDIRRTGKTIKPIAIPSEYVTGNYLKVFIAYHLAIEDKIIGLHPKDSLPAEAKHRGDFILKEYKKYCTLSFNDSTEVMDYEFKFQIHPQTRQKGLVTWLDISHLDNGKNELKVKLAIPASDNTLGYQDTFFIPFIKDSN